MKHKCRYCGEPVPIREAECYRHWELHYRIEREPEMALRMLGEIKPDLLTLGAAVERALQAGVDNGEIDRIVADTVHTWTGVRVFHIEAGEDRAWEDAETGWYWGEIDGYDCPCGDSTGPFATEEEAKADMEANR